MVEPQRTSPPPTPADAQRQEVILCVDDEPSALSVLQEQLEEAFGADCDVAVAQSGEQALEVLDSLDPEQDALAVVIADQIMPGMSGTELLEVISGRAPGAMKILLTGQAGLDAVVHAINTFGLHQYIAKPWDAENLRLAVEGLLQRFRLREQNARLVEHLQAKNAELAELNATQFSQPFEAKRSYLPRFDLPEMVDLRVTVVPKGLAIATASRADHQHVNAALRRRHRAHPSSGPWGLKPCRGASPFCCCQRFSANSYPLLLAGCYACSCVLPCSASQPRLAVHSPCLMPMQHLFQATLK